MVCKIDLQTCKSEFESHWVPHLFGLVLLLSETLRKLLPEYQLPCLVVGRITNTAEYQLQDRRFSLGHNQASIPGLAFESVSSKVHQAYITQSKVMTSIVQQGLSLGLCPTFPFPNPTISRPSGHSPCVKSGLVRSRDK